MKNVASSLCGGAITIQKLTDSGPNGTYVPTSGWNIGAEVVGEPLRRLHAAGIGRHDHEVVDVAGLPAKVV